MQPLQDLRPDQPKESETPYLDALVKNHRPRYDWDLLKHEFMNGPWDSVVAFCKDKGFMIEDKKTKLIFRRTKGWAGEKQKMMALAARNIPIDPLKREYEMAQSAKDRHIRMAKFLQQRGLAAIRKIDPKSADEARKMISTGIEQERLALGLDREKGGQPSLTQVNLNFPKTQLDSLIHGRDFAGLLKLVADIRRERARRTGEPGNTESKGEVING